MDKVLKGILEEVAAKHGVEYECVEDIFNSPYKQMREVIGSLEVKGKTREEVEQLKTNFNMPNLFKLFLDPYKLEALNKKLGKDE